VSVSVVVMLLEMFMGVWNGPSASLGELALREAVRRQAVAAAVRRMTEADLEPAPVREPAPKPAVAAAGAAEAAKAGEKIEEPPKDEKWWRARITAARGALDRDRLLFSALENRITTLTRDITNRDDPAQRAVLMNDRIRAVEELEMMRKQILADTAAIAAIEEEARREGVPPGWIRLD
jgi:hypothetical protein